MHLLFPDTTSLAKEPLLAYRVGLSHPKVGLPAALRAALTSDTIPAKAGVEAEVPHKYAVAPFTTVL